MRIGRVILASVLVALSFSSLSAATLAVTVLMDQDVNSATGCAASGMSGVERRITTTVDQAGGTAVVLSVRSEACSGSTFAPPVDHGSGWPAGLAGDVLSIESRVAFTDLGITPVTPVRYGFVFETPSGTTEVLNTPAGDPLVYPQPTPRRRSAAPAFGTRNFVMDGNVAEWSGLAPLLDRGLIGVWIHSGSNALQFRFDLRGSSGSPAAADDVYGVRQGHSVTIAAPGVLANDTDPEGNALSAELVNAPAHGTLSLEPDGGFVYNQNGSPVPSDAFEYKASDGASASNTARVTITVTPDSAPAAAADAYDTVRGGTLTVPAPGVLANDSDPDSDPITARIVAGPASGSVTLAADGSFTYVHGGAAGTTDSFTYEAFDGVLASTATTVTITIAGFNSPPVADGDAYTTSEDVPLVVPSSAGLLANDVDIDGDVLTAAVISGPTHGALVLAANGSFTYTPFPNYFGPDAFTYHATDGLLTSSATVTLTITPVNDAPVVVNDAFTVAEGGTLNATSVLANDLDREGSPLAATLVAGPAHAASFALNADGTFSYVHDGSETTTDAFTYRAGDGALQSAIATVVISVTPVNDAPVATVDGYSVDEAATLNAASVLVNDTDAEGTALTAVLVTGPAHASSFALNANGTFTYVNDGSETTSDSFSYRANDGTASSNVVTVSITVNPVNDAPAGAGDAAATTEGGTLNGTSVLANDTDAEGSALTAILVIGPSHSTSFTLNADGTFNYVHDGSETTTDSFTYRASDGVAQSAVTTVTITIAPVNDAPVATADAYVVNEGTTLTAATVLANDTDLDSGALTATALTTPANAASFTFNPDGTFTYVHDGSETTAASFTYRVNDGSLDSNVVTVTIAVNPVNDAPVAVADNAGSVLEGGTLNGASVLANDSDAEGGTLTAVLVAGPAHAVTFTLNADGTFTYVHDGSETPTDSFSYRANDGTADSNVVSVTIAVTAVNDAPVAVADAASVAEGGSLTAPSVLANDSDAEGNALTAVLVSGPANASAFTLNADGTFSYTHDGGETLSDSFTYRANDGTADSNVVAVTISISGVNDAPAAVADARSVNEGATLNSTSVLSNDSDPENGTLSAILVTGPANATSFTLNADGTFTYVHDGSETASDSFTYKANDGTLDSNTVTVTITVNAVNDAPVAANDGRTVAEGGTLNATSVLANDTDAEANPITAVLVAGPAHASAFTLNPDGTFTYVHDGSETTSDSFTYRANDGTSDSNTATVTITVTPVNDAPVAVADSRSVNEGATLNSSSVLANDTDAENSTLTAGLVSGPANASAFTLNGDGTFSYTHDGSETVSDSFTYRANDGALDSNVVTVTITVNAVNEAPSAVNDGYAVNEGATLNATSVLGNDSDPENDTLTAALVSGPSRASSFTLNADGTFTYVHDGSETTTDTFTYTANDASLASNTATVTITIAPQNDAPVANADVNAVIEDSATNPVGGNVLANDVDADGESLSVVAVNGAGANVAAPISGTYGTTSIAANGVYGYTLDNARAVVQALSRSASVTDSVTYTAQDPSAAQSTASLVITVSGANDAPAAVANSYNIPAGGTLSATSVLANDTDVDTIPVPDTLSAVLVSDDTIQGDLTFNGNGTFTFVRTCTEPCANQTDTFTYKANDGLADSNVVTVTLNFNRAPVAVADAFTTSEGSSLVVTTGGTHLLSNDSDADGNISQVEVVSAPSAGSFAPGAAPGDTDNGAFTWVPPSADFEGTVTFTYRLVDSFGATSNTATVTITVNGINDAPSFTAGASITHAAGTSGAQAQAGWATAISAGPFETQTLTFVLNVTSNAGIFSASPSIDSTTGTLTYTLSGTSGLATIQVFLQDNGGTAGGGVDVSATQTFTIGVGAVNQAPSFTKGANVSALEDAGAQTRTNWATAINPGTGESGQVVSFVVTTNNNALFSVLPAIDGSGTLTWTTAANANGSATVTVRAVDNGGTAGGGVDTSAPQTFTLSTTAVNDQPSLLSLGASLNRGLNPGTVTVPAFATWSTGPANESGQTVTFTVTQTATTNGSLFSVAPAIGSTGTLTFTVADNQSGSATFSVVVVDNGGIANGGQNTSTSLSFSITIAPGVAPTVPAASIDLTAYANVGLSITNDASDQPYRLLEGAVDPDGQTPLSVFVDSLPVNASLVVNDAATGAFTYYPAPPTYVSNVIQPQVVKYRVCDSAVPANCSVQRTINFTWFSPVVYFVDDNAATDTDNTAWPTYKGLGTLQKPFKKLPIAIGVAVPDRMWSTARPGVKLIIMSGTYDLTYNVNAIFGADLAKGDEVYGQGLAGLSFTSLGITDPPVGSLPALPDLSTGTRPYLDSKHNGSHADPVFSATGGVTLKHLRIKKGHDFFMKNVLTQTGTAAGEVYNVDDVICDNGVGFSIASNGGTLNISNSNLTMSVGFSSSLTAALTVNVTNTPITITTGAALNSANSLISTSSNVTYTSDAASPLTLTGNFSQIVGIGRTSGGAYNASFQPIGTFTINGDVTINRTGTATGLDIYGVAGPYAMNLNGKVDVTTATGRPLLVSSSAIGNGTLQMPNAANRFVMTGSSSTAAAIEFGRMQVGASGVNLSNLAITGGNLTFTDTQNGPAGPITIKSGTVTGNGAQACVALTNAANVTVDPAVVFANCTP